MLFPAFPIAIISLDPHSWRWHTGGRVMCEPGTWPDEVLDRPQTLIVQERDDISTTPCRTSKGFNNGYFGGLNPVAEPPKSKDVMFS